MKLYIITILATVVVLVQVSPSNAQAGCTITSYPEIASALRRCSSLTLQDIVVPARTTLFLNLQPGASLRLLGRITWEFDGPYDGLLMQIEGVGVTVDGAGCIIDGGGPKFWDGKGDGGVPKPKFLKVRTKSHSTIKNMYLLNCPKQCVSIDTSSGTTFDNFNIDISAGLNLPGALAHNTDGFDISSSIDITIQNSIVQNQDDCVAVNQGSNIIVNNLICIGGHGLSLSVGQSAQSGIANTVRNVTFSDCNVRNSQNGIHIKTHKDAGTGSVSLVTYKNITLVNTTNFGILVQQNYEKRIESGLPSNNIPISELILNGVTGNMLGRSSLAVGILCANGACPNWSWSGVSITNAQAKDSCSFDPPGYTCKV